MRLGVRRGPRPAIELVRKRRCSNAVESHRQEQFVAAFAAHLESCGLLNEDVDPHGVEGVMAVMGNQEVASNIDEKLVTGGKFINLF